jgi:hypothetical protein
MLLKQAGVLVAVVEAGRVACGVTGYATAKVTSLHGLVYAKLARTFGEPGARVYGQANQEGSRCSRATIRGEVRYSDVGPSEGPTGSRVDEDHLVLVGGGREAGVELGVDHRAATASVGT